VMRAFSGVKAAVIGLVAAAAWRVGRQVVTSPYALAASLVALVLSVFDLLPIVWIIILGGISGIIYFSRREGGVAK
jgi:chromate transport protein ChrA